MSWLGLVSSTMCCSVTPIVRRLQFSTGQYPTGDANACLSHHLHVSHHGDYISAQETTTDYLGQWPIPVRHPLPSPYLTCSGVWRSRSLRAHFSRVAQSGSGTSHPMWARWASRLALNDVTEGERHLFGISCVECRD